MQNIQMIVMDMDGTLLNSHQNITPYTRDVLIDLQKQGKSIVLASGRDIHSLMKYGDILNFSDYPQSGYICLNGLAICNSKGQFLHKEKGLTYQDSILLEKIAQKYKLDMIFFFEKALFIIEYGYTGIIEHHFVSMVKYSVQSVQNIPQEYFCDLRKIAFIQKEKNIDEIIISLQNDIYKQFDICRVEKDWMEVNPYGINKGNALKRYAKINHILLDQVMAFGNGENDIDMLKIAGYGIAMDNSFENVKNIADDICGSCEEDGIGKYLEGVFKI